MVKLKYIYINHMKMYMSSNYVWSNSFQGVQKR